jgi:hypothetical protein
MPAIHMIVGHGGYKPDASSGDLRYPETALNDGDFKDALVALSGITKEEYDFGQVENSTGGLGTLKLNKLVFDCYDEYISTLQNLAKAATGHVSIDSDGNVKNAAGDMESADIINNALAFLSKVTSAKIETKAKDLGSNPEFARFHAFNNASELKNTQIINNPTGKAKTLATGGTYLQTETPMYVVTAIGRLMEINGFGNIRSAASEADMTPEECFKKIKEYLLPKIEACGVNDDAASLFADVNWYIGTKDDDPNELNMIIVNLGAGSSSEAENAKNFRTGLRTLQKKHFVQDDDSKWWITIQNDADAQAIKDGVKDSNEIFVRLAKCVGEESATTGNPEELWSADAHAVLKMKTATTATEHARLTRLTANDKAKTYLGKVNGLIDNVKLLKAAIAPSSTDALPAKLDELSQESEYDFYDTMETLNTRIQTYNLLVDAANGTVADIGTFKETVDLKENNKTDAVNYGKSTVNYLDAGQDAKSYTGVTEADVNTLRAGLATLLADANAGSELTVPANVNGITATELNDIKAEFAKVVANANTYRTDMKLQPEASIKDKSATFTKQAVTMTESGVNNQQLKEVLTQVKTKTDETANKLVKLQTNVTFATNVSTAGTVDKEVAALGDSFIESFAGYEFANKQAVAEQNATKLIAKITELNDKADAYKTEYATYKGTSASDTTKEARLQGTYNELNATNPDDDNAFLSGILKVLPGYTAASDLQTKLKSLTPFEANPSGGGSTSGGLSGTTTPPRTPTPTPPTLQDVLDAIGAGNYAIAGNKTSITTLDGKVEGVKTAVGANKDKLEAMEEKIKAEGAFLAAIAQTINTSAATTALIDAFPP